MSNSVQFTTNVAVETEILAHLLRCDRQFSPRLSERVDIPAYAHKIRAMAETFEAWSDSTLIGLVAAYMNPTACCCFITNVSVVDKFCGQGIAGRLLAASLECAQRAGIDATVLEVSEQSHAALRLYGRFGFRTLENRGGTLSMKCLHAQCRVEPHEQ